MTLNSVILNILVAFSCVQYRSFFKRQYQSPCDILDSPASIHQEKEEMTSSDIGFPVELIQRLVTESIDQVLVSVVERLTDKQDAVEKLTEARLASLTQGLRDISQALHQDACNNDIRLDNSLLSSASYLEHLSQFLCHLCRKTFKSLEDLDIHIKAFHSSLHLVL